MKEVLISSYDNGKEYYECAGNPSHYLHLVGTHINMGHSIGVYFGYWQTYDHAYETGIFKTNEGLYLRVYEEEGYKMVQKINIK